MEQSKELLPIPTGSLSDWISRLFEIGNGKHGGVERFITGFAKEHPGSEDGKQKDPLTVELNLTETKEGFEYIVRLKPTKKAGKVIRMTVQLQKELLDSDSAAGKIWTLILGRSIQKGFNIKDGKFVDTAVQIGVSELVELGIFSSAEIARKCMGGAMAKLQGLTIRIAEEGVISWLPLLSEWRYIKDQGHWVIFLNNRIPIWALLLQSYTRIPVSAFKLSNRAFGLVRYLTLLFNMNRKKVQQTGNFIITADSLIRRLGINKDTRYKGQLIAGPIKKLIDEVNKSDVGFQLKLINTVEKDFLSAKVEVWVGPHLLNNRRNSRRLPSPKTVEEVE